MSGIYSGCTCRSAMRLCGLQAHGQLRFICRSRQRRGRQGSGMSEGKQVVYRQLRKSKHVLKSSCWATQKQLGIGESPANSSARLSPSPSPRQRQFISWCWAMLLPSSCFFSLKQVKGQWFFLSLFFLIASLKSISQKACFEAAKL